MTQGERVAVLVSGGLDSSVLLAELARTGREVVPVYVRSGLVWEEVELGYLRRFLEAVLPEALGRLRVLDLRASDLYRADHWSLNGQGVPDAEAPLDSNYLPGRNVMLLAKAAVLCAIEGIETIALGSLDQNPFPDATPQFFDAFARACTLGLGHDLRVEAPFRSLSKAEAIRRAHDLPLELTFSCASPAGERHCGVCTKCAERQRAFAQAGLSDPTPYAAPPVAL